MGAAERILKSERGAMLPGPWHVEAYGVGTAAPTAYVRAGGLTVCSLTGRNAAAVASVIARLPDLLSDADEATEKVELAEEKHDELTDRLSEVEYELGVMKDREKENERLLAAKEQEIEALRARLAEVRPTL